MFQSLIISSLFVTALGQDDALGRLHARKAEPDAFANEVEQK